MGLGMVEGILWIFIAGAILFVLTGLWVGIYWWLSPHIETPDGKGRVTGICGDTMEICLSFQDNRVSKSSHWTDGCTYSLNCVCVAADLAKGRSPDGILDIDADLIREAVGGLPKDQMHCATLSAEALYAALEDYMLKQVKQGTKGTRHHGSIPGLRSLV